MVQIGNKATPAEAVAVVSTGEIDEKGRIYIPATDRNMAEDGVIGRTFMFEVVSDKYVPIVPVTVSEPGQFTVPKVVRKASGYGPGDEIDYMLRRFEVSTE